MAKKTKLKLPKARGPAKKDGNPFFALRVPAELLRKFKAHAKTKHVDATALVRSQMAKACGFKLERAS